MKKVILIFGEMGIGKNFIGELCSQHLGFPFLDGDKLLPPAFAEKVARFKPLSLDEIDAYVEFLLTPGIIRALDNSDGLVVAQALYYTKHRDYIVRRLLEEGIACKLLYLPVRSWREHFKRLLSRKKGLMWVMYALASKPFFQKPTPLTLSLTNSGDKKVLLDRISYLGLNA